jgi:hypothetical protein
MGYREVIAAQAANSNTRTPNGSPAERAALVAEEARYAEAMRAGVLERERNRTARGGRPPAGLRTNLDFTARGSMAVWSKLHFGAIPDDPGCTVARLDFRDSRAKRASKGDAGSLTTTAKGSRRLPCA